MGKIKIAKTPFGLIAYKNKWEFIKELTVMVIIKFLNRTHVIPRMSVIESNIITFNILQRGKREIEKNGDMDSS